MKESRRLCCFRKDELSLESSSSFESWASYQKALKETGQRLRDRITARSLAHAELNEVRARSGPEVVLFGIGSIIGAGVFVLTVLQALEVTGPSVVLSFAVSGIFATLSVFCYAEFVVEIPVAGEKPLKKIADAFEVLAATANSKTSAMEVAPFSHACSQVSILFGCLGMAFKFAEKDYVSKVEDLKGASQSISTLQSMVEQDVKENRVREGGSHSRNLLRVLRGIDMVRVLFEQILISEGNSLRDPASVAYNKVFAPHHGWAIRKAVSAGLFALPSKSQLVKKLNDDEASAKVEMQKYVTSSGPVIRYVEELFISRELGIDW